MDKFNAMLSLPDAKSLERFLQSGPYPCGATVAWAAYRDTSHDAAPPTPQATVVTDRDFDDLASKISSTLKLEYGSLDWPKRPYQEWTLSDRKEILQMAVTRWQYAPNQSYRDHRFLEDFANRALEHLGNAPGPRANA